MAKPAMMPMRRPALPFFRSPPSPTLRSLTSAGAGARTGAASAALNAPPPLEVHDVVDLLRAVVLVVHRRRERADVDEAGAFTLRHRRAFFFSGALDVSADSEKRTLFSLRAPVILSSADGCGLRRPRCVITSCSPTRRARAGRRGRRRLHASTGASRRGGRCSRCRRSGRGCRATTEERRAAVLRLPAATTATEERAEAGLRRLVLVRGRRGLGAPTSGFMLGCGPAFAAPCSSGISRSGSQSPMPSFQQ